MQKQAECGQRHWSISYYFCSFLALLLFLAFITRHTISNIIPANIHNGEVKSIAAANQFNTFTAPLKPFFNASTNPQPVVVIGSGSWKKTSIVETEIRSSRYCILPLNI